MQTNFSHKMVDCLTLLGLHASLRREYEDVIHARWGEKVVSRKLEELARRGYIEYGVSTRAGWLTEKGKTALRAAMAAYTS